jgi:hypothetical protein
VGIPAANVASLLAVADPEVSRPFTDEQLETAAGHVNYEIQQVGFGTYRTSGRDDPYLLYAILESFLVHVRVLDDFLGNAEGHGDELLATDFCPSYTPVHPLDDADRLAIDRRVARLALERTDSFNWDGRSRLQRAVFSQYRVFLEQLEAAHPERVEWLRPAFVQARKIVRTTMNGWPQQFR